METSRAYGVLVRSKLPRISQLSKMSNASFHFCILVYRNFLAKSTHDFVSFGMSMDAQQPPAQILESGHVGKKQRRCPAPHCGPDQGCLLLHLFPTYKAVRWRKDGWENLRKCRQEEGVFTCLLYGVRSRSKAS